jgi:hypothetical protein
MKTRKRLLIFCFDTAAAFVPWLFRAELVLSCAPFLERKGESGGQWLRDSLISCGPSSIGPTIATLRRESPWARNYCYLPAVLRHFGEHAHQQLLMAIDSETDNRSRSFLIFSLQDAFNDFSRLDRWLAEPVSTSSYAITFMAHDVRRAFPDAPPLKSESSSGLNPDFLAWWRVHQSK